MTANSIFTILSCTRNGPSSHQLMVSGLDEEQKNVDRNISKCRKSIFGLLGPTFAYSVKVSPAVQLHLWRVYCLPVMLSGLDALPVRPTVMKSVSIFHNKILRGFLKLSQTSPTPSIYFLCGELPIEGKIHIRLLSLFYNIVANPQTTVYKIVKYILMMADDKSVTWSVHLRVISSMYGLPDPLQVIQDPPLNKLNWNELVMTRVTIYHEKKWRLKAENNSKMTQTSRTVRKTAPNSVQHQRQQRHPKAKSPAEISHRRCSVPGKTIHRPRH